MTDSRPPAGKLAWVPSLAGTAALIALVLAMVVPLEAAQKDPVASVTAPSSRAFRSFLMTTKLSKGLFHRGIGQSGAVLTVGPSATLAQAEQAGVKVASALKASGTGALQFLRARSTTDLLRAGGAGPAGINVDGWVFARPPADVFAAGKQRGIPLILGSNAIELDGPDSPASLRKTIEARYGALADRAYQLYGVSGPADEGKTDPVYGGPSRQWAADTGFRCPTLMQSEWHSRARRATWVYQFDRAIPPRPVTAHSADLPYVFGNLYSKGSQAGEFTALDRKLSASILAYWTNFARTGNPNGVGLPPWPRYDARSPQILELTKAAEIVVGKDQRRSFCELFRESLQQSAKAMPGRRGGAH